MMLRIKLIACIAGSVIGVGFLLWLFIRMFVASDFFSLIREEFQKSFPLGVRIIYDNFIIPIGVVLLSLRFEEYEHALSVVFILMIFNGFLKMVIDPGMGIDVPGIAYIIQAVYLTFISMVVCAIKGLILEARKCFPNAIKQNV